MRNHTLRLPGLWTMFCFVLTASTSLPGQSPVTANLATPLGLPRLRVQPPKDAPASLKAAEYDVDALDVPAYGQALGLRKENQGSSEVIKIGADKELVRTLKTTPGKVAYYSFLLYGSPYSILSFEGVSLAFATSPVSGGLELMAGVGIDGKLSWRSTNQHLSVEKYGGQNLAGSPVLTVRVDPKAGEWDLFAGSRQVASNLPLLADGTKGAKRELVLHGGADGLWLAGFVQSSANPLFEDANDNGVDDAFERTQRGALLKADATVADRRALAAAARDAAFAKTPEAWFFDRPRPDRALPAN